MSLGFGICVEQDFRLYGIDPKIGGTVDHYQQHNGKERLRQFILNKNVIVKSYKHKSVIYLADMYIETSHGIICINDWLVTEKLAVYRNNKNI